MGGWDRVFILLALFSCERLYRWVILHLIFNTSGGPIKNQEVKGVLPISVVCFSENLGWWCLFAVLMLGVLKWSACSKSFYNSDLHHTVYESVFSLETNQLWQRGKCQIHTHTTALGLIHVSVAGKEK